ncbi:hypothetical protein AeRB84_014391 [Aphanomyces euteiches]|nr:hypothetical protein AeRB84_014391 [Aphanomyces euteiches]
MATRWTDEDDMALLTQANNDRPFLLEKDIMKGWDSLGTSLLQGPGFSRLNLDGKKAAHRFHLLLDKHEVFQKESTYMSGVDQGHTKMHILLDDLAALRADNAVAKKNKQDTAAAEKARSEDGARHIR